MDTTTISKTAAKREVNRRKGKFSTVSGKKLTKADARTRAVREGTFGLTGPELKAILSQEPPPCPCEDCHPAPAKITHDARLAATTAAAVALHDEYRRGMAKLIEANPEIFV